MYLNERQKIVLERRILVRNEKGEIVETPMEMFKRVAKFVAAAEKNNEKKKLYEKKFFEIMKNLEFLPNSPCLVNAGVEGRKHQLAACFVLVVEDKIDNIYETLKNAAIIHKTGGGTGFDFSKIRPEGSIVNTTKGIASGPVSFMKIYDVSTEQIKQGGVRRGANIGVLRVDHPDILKFIEAKKGKDCLKNFNLSVAITNEFVEAVKNDSDFVLKHEHSDLTVTMKARDIWSKIVKNAHSTGDPGLLFIDRINELHPVANYEIRATNPCGETVLADGELCCLGSINLSNFYNEKTNNIDFKRLGEVVSLGIRFLDNILDVNEYPLEKIKKITLDNRKIGLGVMGWADLLIKMKIPYSSEEALELAEKIMSFILAESARTSNELGKEKGPFQNIDNYKPYPAIQKLIEENLNMKIEDYKPRNATLTAIAPTGTLSIIANCSSGIEPVFAFETLERRVDTEIVHYHPLYKEWLENNPDEETPEYFITAHEVEVDYHIRMQAAFQKYNCNSVSKTINLSKGSSEQDVFDAFIKAYDYGCKGITVYVDGSLEGQTLSVQIETDTEEVPQWLKPYVEQYEELEEKEVVEFIKKNFNHPFFTNGLKPIDRIDHLQGYTYRIKTGYGNLYVTINELVGKPFEVFCQIGRSGASELAKAEAVGKLVSLALRSGIQLEYIIEQIDDIMGSEPILTKKGYIKSIPDAMAKVLREYMEKKQHKEVKLKISPKIGKQICPECGNDLVPDSRCPYCGVCGWKSCGG
jgi:ribonucleoside-diphosphate reductase alpha chain